jgi:small-conductance mechanosensitive channel
LKFQPLSVSVHVHSRTIKTTALLCGLVIAVCIALAPWIAAQDTETDSLSKPPEIRKRLAEVRAEIQALPTDADPVLRERLEQLEEIRLFHLAAVDVLAKARSKRDEAARALSSWQGFSQPPPHSIRQLDEIREKLATLESSRSAADAQARIFASQIETAHDDLDSHQQAGRSYAEVAASAGSPEARQSAERSVRIEQVASLIANEEIARFTLRLEAQRAERAMLDSQIELAGMQLKAIEGKTGFQKNDLTEIQLRITRERSDAVAKLVAAKHGSQAPDPLLTWKIEFLDLENVFWSTRFNAHEKKDATTRREALATFDKLKKRIDDWGEIAQLRLVGMSTNAAEIDPVTLREAIQQVARMKRLIGFAIDDLKGSERRAPSWDDINSGLFAIWNTELYLAEETEIIDGRKIPVFRAVTLGKLVRLAFILAVGWWILRYLSRRLAALLARKSKIPDTAAVTAVKLFAGFGLVLLVIYGLNAVHIPFTAFAFLGGALAIGVGFGTQTLLKNFISGIILIFERPLRVGDVVEIEGVTGRIKSIGMRASVIQHFDGIDTLIPNSILLENQVTNWTFSSSVIRHSVLIGVAYGSPTREVAKALLQVADEHGLVVDDPAPEVRFEDFGADALVFRLLFWLDTAKTGRDPLASDLRFMIDKAFAQAGIVIAYPQRDVHFDRETPLRVELSRSPKSEP